MNFVLENPKAVVTATAGIIIFAIKTFLLKDYFTPEIESWLNLILTSVFLGLLGRYTRITKSQATVLEMPQTKVVVNKEENLKEKNQLD